MLSIVYCSFFIATTLSPDTRYTHNNFVQLNFFLHIFCALWRWWNGLLLLLFSNHCSNVKCALFQTSITFVSTFYFKFFSFTLSLFSSASHPWINGYSPLQNVIGLFFTVRCEKCNEKFNWLLLMTYDLWNKFMGKSLIVVFLWKFAVLFWP